MSYYGKGGLQKAVLLKLQKYRFCLGVEALCSTGRFSSTVRGLPTTGYFHDTFSSSPTSPRWFPLMDLSGLHHALPSKGSPSCFMPRQIKQSDESCEKMHLRSNGSLQPSVSPSTGWQLSLCTRHSPGDLLLLHAALLPSSVNPFVSCSAARSFRRANDLQCSFSA